MELGNFDSAEAKWTGQIKSASLSVTRTETIWREICETNLVVQDTPILAHFEQYYNERLIDFLQRLLLLRRMKYPAESSAPVISQPQERMVLTLFGGSLPLSCTII